jgi:hypothetical protein
VTQHRVLAAGRYPALVRPSPFATLMLRKDPRATMEQGSWLDIRSVIGYAHDVPECIAGSSV